MGHEYSTAILNCQRENLYSPAVPCMSDITIVCSPNLPLTIVGYTQMTAKKKWS